MPGNGNPRALIPIAMQISRRIADLAPGIQMISVSKTVYVDLPVGAA
jgi:hypothetical protein